MIVSPYRWCTAASEGLRLEREVDQALLEMDPTGVTALDLSESDVTDEGLRLLGERFFQLRALDISETNHLTVMGLRELRKVADLEELEVDLDGRDPTWVGELSSLKTLIVTGAGDDLIESLQPAAATLQELKLEGCQRLSDEGLRKLSSMKRLQALSIHDADFVTSNGFHVIAALSSLRMLVIRRRETWPIGSTRTSVAFDDGNVGALIGLPVEVVHLEDTRITDEGMKYFQRCSALKHLTLLACKSLSLDGFQWVAELPLRSLRVDVLVSDSGGTHDYRVVGWVDEGTVPEVDTGTYSEPSVSISMSETPPIPTPTTAL